MERTQPTCCRLRQTCGAGCPVKQQADRTVTDCFILKVATTPGVLIVGAAEGMEGCAGDIAAAGLDGRTKLAAADST